MSSEFRPEQMRARDLIAEYLDGLRRSCYQFPNYYITLEYEIKEWEKIKKLEEGLELRGMPILDIAIFFPSIQKKIGIQLDGESHTMGKRIHDENQALILSHNWGHIVRIMKMENDRIWNGDSVDASNHIIDALKPILLDMGLIKEQR